MQNWQSSHGFASYCDEKQVAMKIYISLIGQIYIKKSMGHKNNVVIIIWTIIINVIIVLYYDETCRSEGCA